MLFLLLLTIVIIANGSLSLLCAMLEIDVEYDSFRVLTVGNVLAVTWFAWLVMEAGVTVEVLVK